MKSSKKPLVVLLILAMLMGTLLSGCGTAAPAAVSQAAASASATEAASAAPSATATAAEATASVETSNVNEAGVFPIVKEKVTITAMVVLLPWVSDMVTNDYTQALEQRTNVHLDMTVVPNDGYADKLKLVLSTGDYPEIIMSNAAGSNLDVVNYGINEKIYQPLNKYIDQYSINLKQRWQEMPEIKAGMTAPDGNIYALPTFEGMVGHGAVSFKSWINTSWLDKLGLKKPTTTEEFKQVLMAFKTKDPNGNGKADEVPLSGAINTWAADPYLYLLNAFDYYDWSLMKMNAGKFSFVADTEGFRKGLTYIADLYANGLLDPASLTQDQSQLAQLGNSTPTVLGTYTAGHISMGIDIANMELSKQYDYLLPLKGPDGVVGTPVVSKQAPQGGNFAITDKCKNPEAAFRIADIFYDSKEAMVAVFGPKGTKWDDADAGAKGVTGFDAIWKTLPSTNYSNNPVNTAWSGTTCNGTQKDWKLYMQFQGDLLDATNYEARLIKITKEYENFPGAGEQIMPMWADAETATKLGNRFTPINDYVKTSIVEFITGKKSVEKDWTGYMDGLAKLGYKEYVAEYEKTYNASVSK
jgi:putative aldouronate transport system substrate-binding protein